jgi:hypothetical protein
MFISMSTFQLNQLSQRKSKKINGYVILSSSILVYVGLLCTHWELVHTARSQIITILCSSYDDCLGLYLLLSLRVLLLAPSSLVSFVAQPCCGNFLHGRHVRTSCELCFHQGFNYFWSMRSLYSLCSHQGFRFLFYTVKKG